MSERTFAISGRLPGLNDYVRACRGDRYAANRIKRVEEERVAFAAIHQDVRAVDGTYALHCHWVEPDKRRDPDNVRFGVKFILDALVAVGLLPGDGPRHCTGLSDTFSYDKHEPRVVVTIIEEQR